MEGYKWHFNETVSIGKIRNNFLFTTIPVAIAKNTFHDHSGIAKTHFTTLPEL
jgi:hypothetical protein